MSLLRLADPLLRPQWYIGLDRHPFDTDARPVGKDGSSDSLSPSTERNKVSQLDVKVMGQSFRHISHSGYLLMVSSET